MGPLREALAEVSDMGESLLTAHHSLRDEASFSLPYSTVTAGSRRMKVVPSPSSNCTKVGVLLHHDGAGDGQARPLPLGPRPGRHALVPTPRRVNH